MNLRRQGLETWIVTVNLLLEALGTWLSSVAFNVGVRTLNKFKSVRALQHKCCGNTWRQLVETRRCTLSPAFVDGIILGRLLFAFGNSRCARTHDRCSPAGKGASDCSSFL